MLPDDCLSWARGSFPRLDGSEPRVSPFVDLTRWASLIWFLSGAYFKPDETFTPSAVKAKWNQIGDFSQGSEYPVGMEGKDPMVGPSQNTNDIGKPC